MSLTAEQLAKLTKLSHLQSLAARTKAVTDDLQEQINTLDGGAIKEVQVNGTALTPAEGAVNVLVTVEKKTTPNTGYAASYVVKANGVAVGDPIDVAKDWLLTSVDKDTVTAADKASGGKFENDTDFEVGDRYVDMTFNVKAGGTETPTHIYLNVQEFFDVYTNGNGLNLSNGEFSVKLDSSNTNGLSVGANGVALAVATDSAAGAMSATDHANFTADHTKLSNISEQANKTTVTTAGSGAIEIDGTSYAVVNIAADADVAEMLDTELPAPSSGSGE